LTLDSTEPKGAFHYLHQSHDLSLATAQNSLLNATVLVFAAKNILNYDTLWITIWDACDYEMAPKRRR
jgi:hypothetical protein